MDDYHLRVYQRIAPYIGISLLKILDLENKVSDQKTILDNIIIKGGRILRSLPYVFKKI